jgi:hypothetical protein
MSVFVVSWNLNKEKSNYNAARAAFITHLQRYPFIRDPQLETVWFLQSAATAASVDIDLRVKLDDDDRLVVSKMNRGEHAGWLNKDVWAWIEARL